MLSARPIKIAIFFYMIKQWETVAKSEKQPDLIQNQPYRRLFVIRCEKSLSCCSCHQASGTISRREREKLPSVSTAKNLVRFDGKHCNGNGKIDIDCSSSRIKVFFSCLCRHVMSGNEGRFCYVDLQVRRECFGG